MITLVILTAFVCFFLLPVFIIFSSCACIRFSPVRVYSVLFVLWCLVDVNIVVIFLKLGRKCRCDISQLSLLNRRIRIPPLQVQRICTETLLFPDRRGTNGRFWGVQPRSGVIERIDILFKSQRVSQVNGTSWLSLCTDSGDHLSQRCLSSRSSLLWTRESRLVLLGYIIRLDGC